MRSRLLLILALTLVTLGFTQPFASAQLTTGRANSRQTETLLIRIETRIEVLKDEAERVAQRNSDAEPGEPDQLSEYLTSLGQNMAQVRETFDNGNPIARDLRVALTTATSIDRFLARNRVTPAAQTQWRNLKRDLTSLATSNRVGWNWNQPIPPTGEVPSNTPAYTVSDSQLRTLLSRIGLKTNNYKLQLNSALRADTDADLPDQTIVEYVAALEAAEVRLRQRFDARLSTDADATDVLLRAAYIDQFMGRNRLNAQTQAQWRNLKADLNTLATYYGVSWNWNQTLPTNTGGIDPRVFDSSLTGTYRLNSSLSENQSAAIDEALRTTPTIEREAYRRRLEQRLSSPEVIAIEKVGTKVSLASSILPQVSFQADGVARSETNARGRTVTTTVTADDDGLIINYQGERASDFYLTFLPMPDRRLKVTRRIYLDNGNNSITVSSIYDKVDNVARWDAVNIDTNTGGTGSTVNDSYIVPNGTRMSAELRTSITGAQAGDRFIMDVTAPGQYRGAVISGRVISEDPNSRLQGRSRVLLIFDTIRLSRGETYRFAGNVDAVTAVNGEIVSVTNQSARAATQTPRNVGGVLGALIGAIAGVPVDSGATSATTAGAVLAQNGDAIDIGAGSQFVLTATTAGVGTTPR